ncbi:MAG: DHH family phosphoesterase [Halobacteriales archaeon]|nr:DHH family phosphoesterase [Halobacteriales archaeon]
MTEPSSSLDDEPSSADDSTVVYRLMDDCTIDDLEEGAYYHATVDGVVDYGIFVEIAPGVSGLVHESNLDTDYAAGDPLIVELTDVKQNGDLSFAPVSLDESAYGTVTVEHEYEPVRLDHLDDHIGETVHIEGTIVQIKQTAGPTLFHVSDGTYVVPVAAFESAGVRAYPELAIGDFVHAVGIPEQGDHGMQIESERIDGLDETAAAEVQAQFEARIDEGAAPNEIEPLVAWPALAKLIPGLEEVATHLRRSVLENRPIAIRHHADSDGMCASLPVQRALEQFIRETHADPEAPRHLIKRLPSKAPFYEMEDVTRDLNYALEGQDRHGQKLPLLLMIDNGSTEEDVPAYKHLDAYDIPVIVIDHHHPDPEAVEPYLETHVNPYLQDEDYRITTGMLCVELARMIDESLTDRLKHVPGVAGLADRSAADAMEEYLSLAEAVGYTEADLDDIGDALDYAAHWLKYAPGEGLIDDILNLAGNDDRHGELVELFAGRAHRDIERQLEAALPHVEEERLSNAVTLYQLDLDEYAHRFTYPAPGTTTGAIHDRMVEENGEPAITIGFGPDFAVLRSDGVRLDIPEMVTELNEELAGAGVSGGGHLVVGSIRFVPGMRQEVLNALISKMAQAEIDESLHATPVRDQTGDPEF